MKVDYYLEDYSGWYRVLQWSNETDLTVENLNWENANGELITEIYARSEDGPFVANVYPDEIRPWRIRESRHTAWILAYYVDIDNALAAAERRFLREY